MKTLFSVLLLSCVSYPAFASSLDVFNLNVFDQLQGEWKADFREDRLHLVGDYIRGRGPGIVVFEEAQGNLPGAQGGGSDSVDAASIAMLYPHRKYIHEMTGKDRASYGYWIGAKKKPREWIEENFSFEGGVARKVIGGVWDKALGKRCLGVLGLHLSYQTSEVRQKEAAWLLDWLKSHESKCRRWLVVGDFNADSKDKEMQILFEGGLKSLYKEIKPTIGAFNPIRRIYGEDIPSLTIDWALGWNLAGTADVVLDSPYTRELSGPEHEPTISDWVSDHAGVFIHLKK
jgi:endonuclease/exonuclease/phosphatase family metal-dependent hydrolase